MSHLNDTRQQDDDQTPTLLAERTEGHQVKIWCPYCSRPKGRRGDWHYHGDGGSAGPSLGHRGAHCWDPTSPFLHANGGRGYFLRLNEEGDRG